MSTHPNLSRLFQTAGSGQKQQGSGYTNLNRLIAANQGNLLGQKVAGDLEGQIGDVRTQLSTEQQQFDKESEAGRLGTKQAKERDAVIGRFTQPSGTQPVPPTLETPTLETLTRPHRDGSIRIAPPRRRGGGRVYKRTGEVDGVTTPQQSASGALAVPEATQGVLDQGTDGVGGDVDMFSRFRSGAYGGPKGLKDTSGLSLKASGLAQQTASLSPSGTQELLRQSVGGEGYTQGQSRLDSLLMDRSRLTPISRQAQALGQQIDQANIGARGRAQEIASENVQFGKRTTGMLDEGLKGIDVATELRRGEVQGLEDARLKSLGVMQQFQQNLRPKLDPTTGKVMMQPGTNTPIMETVRTGDQYAQMDQLKALMEEQGIGADQMVAMFGKGNIKDAQTVMKQQQDVAAQRTASAQQYYNDRQYSYYLDSVRNRENAKNQRAIDAAIANQTRVNIDSSNLYNMSTGITGAAALRGTQQDMINRLMGQLADPSRAAEGLSVGGVASVEQKSNYDALQQLMGRGKGAISDYNIADTKEYKAGNKLFDVEKLR